MNKLNKTTTTFLHILVWLVLFTFPYLLSMRSDSGNFEKIIRFNWWPLLLCAIVFYVNYLYLVGKFFLNRKFVIYFLINIVIFVFLIWLKQFVLNAYLFDPEIKSLLPKGISNGKIPPNRFPQPAPPPRNFFIYLDTLSLIIPLIFAISLKMSERWIKVETEKKEAQTVKLQSELQHLKYQLQPHFFFNALNNIYSLVDISPESAKQTIYSLGKLMRYLLETSNSEKIELSREVDFLSKYIELMSIRMPKNVLIKKDFDEIRPGLKISSLLFISLIENAFKHGVSAVAPSFIEFKLKENDGVVSFYSINTDFSKSESDKSGSGIGLLNLKKRLYLLYPEKHEFKTEIRSGNTFEVSLIIDLNDE